MGATPLWGGAREPKEEASGWLSEAKDQTLASSFGEGGAGGRSASVQYAAELCDAAYCTLARPIREHGHHYCAPQGGEGSERQRARVKTRRL